MEALRYRPSAFLRLDDTAPFQDYSGYGNSGSATGSVTTKANALVADAAYAMYFSVGGYVTTTVPSIYQRGKESQPFSLSAVIYMPTFGQNRVISKAGQFDGLWVDNGTIKFTTSYLTTGSATASYTPLQNQKFNIVGVHSQTKNSLFVNGELVAEVDITPEQQADQYLTSDTDKTFISGLGSVVIIGNNLGWFPKALLPQEIEAMYEADRRRPEGAAAKGLGGEVFEFGPEVRSPYLNVSFDSDEEWLEGQLHQVEPEDGVLYGSLIDELTLGGTWQGSISVFEGETAVPINSINFWWTGRNVTVETSLDSTTWTAVTKGVRITNYSTNQTPTSDSLFIRVNFTAGVSEAWIQDLRIQGYTGNTVAYSTDRTITYPDASVPYPEPEDPMSLKDDWGVNLAGGTLTIGNTVSADYPQTVEVWYKRSGTLTVSSNLSGAPTKYIGGGLLGSDRTNEWMVQHYVNSAGISGNITLGGSAIIGHVALFPTALTAAQALQVYENYTGQTKIVATSGSSDITSLAESPTAWQLYSHDWEIQQS
jgi:hypothetical protein